MINYFFRKIWEELLVVENHCSFILLCWRLEHNHCAFTGCGVLNRIDSFSKMISVPKNKLVLYLKQSF